MKLVLLLALLSVGGGGSIKVAGRTGESITLPCKYDIKKHGPLSVCWNRGDLPISGCSNELVSTDGRTVKTDSSRFQLLGRLDRGDVSLTILNATQTDSGRYGCRVKIPGWFNDDKYHIDLTVERAPQTTTWTLSDRDTSTQQTTASPPPGQLTTTGSVPTSSSSISVAKDEVIGSSSVTVALVCVLFGVIVLLTTGGGVLIARKWRQLNKIPQQQVNSSVQFRSTSSNLQLQSRGSAVENIYQIDGDGEGGEYEYCP